MVTYACEKMRFVNRNKEKLTVIERKIIKRIYGQTKGNTEDKRIR